MKKSTKINKKITIAITGALSVLLFVFCVFGISSLKPDDFNSNINSQSFLSNKSIVIDSNQQGVNLQENTNIKNITNNKNEDNAYIIKENQNENSQAAEKSEEKAEQINIRTANILDSINVEDLNTMAVPKRVYSSNGNMLSYKIDEGKNTLYIDKQQTGEGWTDFDSANAAPWVNKNTTIIKHVVIGNDQSEDTIHPTSTKGWFGCMTEPTSGVQPLSNIEDIKGLDKLDMSDVADATCMFIGSDYLKTPQVSDTWFDKLNKVESAACICCYTKKLDNSFLNKMINGIANSVVNAKFSFADNPKLTEVTIADKDNAMKNVIDASFMFRRDKELTKITSGNLIGQNTTTVKAMFTNCSKLERIYLNDDVNWNEMTGLTDSTDLFYNCNKLKGGKDTLFDSGKVDKEYARQDGGPTSSTPGYFTPASIPVEKEAYAVYDADTTTLTFNYDENKPEGAYDIYDECLSMGEYEHISPYIYALLDKTIEPTKVHIESTMKEFAFKNCCYMFYGGVSINEIIGLENLNTDDINNTAYMFYGCQNLKSDTLNLSNLQTKKVESMDCMFYGCQNLSYLDLSKFNTENVKSMMSMFEECKVLVTIVFSENFKTDNVESMNSMFYDCEKLYNDNYLDLSNFNTAKVKDMSYMFAKCYYLGRLNCSSFTAESLTDTFGMFNSCGVEHIDFSNLDLSKATNIDAMFYYCPYLVDITCNYDWSSSPSEITYGMFRYDDILVGGKGTKFSDTQVLTQSYARPDGGPESATPGYFTATTPPVEKEAYAIYDADTATLTFKYDGNKPEGAYKILEECDNDNKHEFIGKVNPKTVVIDSSFKNFTLLNTAYMFYDLTNLENIEHLDYLNTEEIKSTSYMFYYCQKLKTLDLKSFNTLNVTDMSYMFNGCNSLETIDLNNFITSNVENMNSLFNGCKSLISIDLSKLDTSKVLNMKSMFQNCAKLTEIDLNSFDTSSATDMSQMFAYCNLLKEIKFGQLFNTSKVTTMQTMFSGCSVLESLDLSKFNTSNVKKMSCMLQRCAALKEIDLSMFDTSNVTDMSQMFALCSSLEEIKFGDNFNTSSVTSMTYMFNECSALTLLDLSKFNTSNVTNMCYIFSNCSLLKEIIFGENFNTSNVTDMSYMFNCCYALLTIDLTKFNTSNVEKMIYMFNRCTSLKSIDVSSFDTSKVKSMQNMFSNVGPQKVSESSLQEVKFGDKFTASNVTIMNSMFSGCNALLSLDLSKFDTSNVTNMSSMFNNCSSLTKIIANDWTGQKVTSSSGMFSNCISLKGNNGTSYDSTHTNIEYARPDGGTSNPGYFTSTTPPPTTKYKVDAHMANVATAGDFNIQYKDASGNDVDEINVDPGTQISKSVTGQSCRINLNKDGVLQYYINISLKNAPERESYAFTLTPDMPAEGIQQDTNFAVSVAVTGNRLTTDGNGKIYCGEQEVTRTFNIEYGATLEKGDSDNKIKVTDSAGVSTIYEAVHNDGFVFKDWTTPIANTTVKTKYTNTANFKEFVEFKGLKFTSLENGNVIKYVNDGGNNPDVKYSTDGENWEQWDEKVKVELDTNKYIYIKGNNRDGFNHIAGKCSNFVVSKKFNVSGNINSLLDDSDGSSISLIPSGCYNSLFKNCIKLNSISEGLLPATILGEECYADMFNNCTGLTSLPKNLLPATELGVACYASMFTDCSGLKSLPEGLLHATNLGEACYAEMFAYCYNLKISEGSGDVKIFDCSNSDYCEDMFYGTGGSFQGTPQTGKSYYCN